MFAIVDPSESLRESFLTAALDYVRAGETKSAGRYQSALDDFPKYLQMIRDMALGIRLQSGWVPMSYFWMVENQSRVVGVSRLRPNLTPQLEIEGGHIGYDVPPSERRKGYGTELLRLTLPKAREAGLSQVLLTVDADNVGSIRIIERNGGQLRDELYVEPLGKSKRRYTIDVGL